MSQFVLKIKLGNDAMQTQGDIAEALINAAHRIEYNGLDGVIMDVNGNSVGYYNLR